MEVGRYMNEKRKIRGIHIETFNYCMIVIACLLYIFIVHETFYLSEKYNNLEETTNAYNTCRDDAAAINDASDYLTEQVRYFSITMQKKYADSYFKEIYETQRRENALKDIQKYQTAKSSQTYLKSALQRSNNLTQTEIYSIKLIAIANDYDLSEFPTALQKMEISSSDLALSSDKQIEKARKIIFDSAYEQEKDNITKDISTFTNKILDTAKSDQTNSADELQKALFLQRIFVSILFFVNIMIFLFIIVLIIRPLHICIDHIQNEKPLKVKGSYEFKYLAHTYNTIYEINAANEALLRHEAEHDPLTGLMNRGVFEHLKMVFKNSSSSIALLLIDVDQFKSINDGYGHEMGDKMLQKVALTLRSNFRSTDHLIRIGGDEFAVIVTDISPNLKDILINKITNMNHTLQNPEDDLPKTSLSVGIAFSSHGFTDTLFQNADQALYKVKENGRCGFSISEIIV
jgi:diguanylate cyclase (GGDEF)-like protein